MKKYILGAVFGLLVGVPTIVLGSSFVSSLVQGKSPSEAISVMGSRIDQLFGRVSTLEDTNRELGEQVADLQKEEPKRVVENKSAEEAPKSSVCLNLEKDIPKISGYSYQATTLPKLYLASKGLIESGKFYTLSSSQQTLEMRMLWDLKPKYDNYHKYCGGSEFSIKLPAQKQAYCESQDTKLKSVLKEGRVTEEAYDKYRKEDRPDMSKVGLDNKYLAEKKAYDQKLKEYKEKIAELESQQEAIDQDMNKNICALSYEVMPG